MTNTEELQKLEFLTIREAADICRFKGTEPIKRAIKRGELQAVNLSNFQILVSRDAFVLWLKQHMVGGTADVESLLKPTKAPTNALKAIAAQRRRARKKTRQIDDKRD